MQNTPYRILFYSNDEAKPNSGWEFDEAEFETAEAAYEASLKSHTYDSVRIVKLCYTKD
jgi:hypothetical protein